MKTIADSLREEGEERGIEKGREKARVRWAQSMVKLFEVHFGPMTKEQRERIHSASIDELEAWSEKAKTAESLEDIIGDS